MAVVYAHHVYTMGFIKFDYGYNMKFNVFIGKKMLLRFFYDPLSKCQDVGGCRSS